MSRRHSPGLCANGSRSRSAPGRGAAHARRRAAAGWSLLELIVVVILIALLFLVGIDRLLVLRTDAEAAALLRMEGAMQASLGAEVAARALRRGPEALLELPGTDPVALLAEAPAAYRAAMPAAGAAALPPGAFAFDHGRGVLVYRVRYPGAFSSAGAAPAHAQWRIELRPSTARSADEVRGVVLARVGSWRWALEDAGGGDAASAAAH